MNQEKLMQAGVEYAEGVQRFAGNTALYEKFLRKFPEDPTFSELKAAIAAKDTETAFRAAHTLKGMAGNLSLRRFTAQVSRLTEVLRDGDLEQAAALYPLAETEYSAVLEALGQ